MGWGYTLCPPLLFQPPPGRLDPPKPSTSAYNYHIWRTHWSSLEMKRIWFNIENGNQTFVFIEAFNMKSMKFILNNDQLLAVSAFIYLTDLPLESIWSASPQFEQGRTLFSSPPELLGPWPDAPPSPPVPSSPLPSLDWRDAAIWKVLCCSWHCLGWIKTLFLYCAATPSTKNDLKNLFLICYIF